MSLNTFHRLIEAIEHAAIFSVENLGREFDDPESMWLGRALAEERTELIERIVNSPQILTVLVEEDYNFGIVADSLLGMGK